MSRTSAPDYAPALLEKFFALRAVQPFDRLPPDELTLLADVARPRSYVSGAILSGQAGAADRLAVVVEGRAVDEQGRPLGPILGVRSLLGLAGAPRASADGPAGARVLEITKRHFFTLAHECPEFIVGLLELGEGGRTAPAP